MCPPPSYRGSSSLVCIVENNYVSVHISRFFRYASIRSLVFGAMRKCDASLIAVFISVFTVATIAGED